MTEKGKAIEDGTIELPTGPAEKKKPHRGRIVVITVAALALLAAGGVAWRAHEDRLMAEARADCAAESERLRVATTAYDALLDGKAASMAKTDVKSVKDAKALDVLSKAMKASTPKTVSCKADSRPGVQDATKGVTANASWYKAHTKSLNGLVNAVETSKLDKTVDDANALYKETDGRVADDKTRASLLDAIEKRDADAIAKAVKEVNESKAAKEKADAEAKARAEQEAAAAAAAAARQAQARQSWPSSGSGHTGYTGNGYSGNTSTPSGGSPGSSSSGGSTWTDPNAGAADGFDWDYVGPSVCEPGKFCPLA